MFGGHDRSKKKKLWSPVVHRAGANHWGRSNTNSVAAQGQGTQSWFQGWKPVHGISTGTSVFRFLHSVPRSNMLRRSIELLILVDLCEIERRHNESGKFIKSLSLLLKKNKGVPYSTSVAFRRAFGQAIDLTAPDNGPS
jgi:hypothetical protein